ncbi:hypothetical protein MIR68_002719 [Amoeboaphelidium protococcarum]|nr:hypothetical protein MIR68_002719 [Amoeboaphelidium protococcarum]
MLRLGRIQFNSALLRRSISNSVKANESQTVDNTKNMVTKGGDKIHGSYHWLFERYLSIATIPVCVYPLMFGPSKGVDFLLGFIIPLHSHLGFGQVITDYLNPRKVGKIGHLAARSLLLAATVTTMYGLYQFNTNDVGITEFVKKLWKGPEKNGPVSK